MSGFLAILGGYYPIPDTTQLHRRGPVKNVTMITEYGLYSFFRVNNEEQPIKSGRKVIMATSNIYNSRELEIQYELKCKTKSDCEVILRLYEKFGFVEAVKKLQGNFAIVLADGEDVYIARDSVGTRPLYLGVGKGGIMYLCSLAQTLDSCCEGIIPITPGLSGVCRKTGLVILARAVTPMVPAIIPYPGEVATCILSNDRNSIMLASILVKQVKKLYTYSIGIHESVLAHCRKVAQFLGAEHAELSYTQKEGDAVVPKVIEVIGSYDPETVRDSVEVYLLAQYIAKTCTGDRTVFCGKGFSDFRNPKDAHLYEILGVERCISYNGLEPRFPLLDRPLTYDIPPELLPIEKISYTLPAKTDCKQIYTELFTKDSKIIPRLP